MINLIDFLSISVAIFAILVGLLIWEHEYHDDTTSL